MCGGKRGFGRLTKRLGIQLGGNRTAGDLVGTDGGPAAPSHGYGYALFSAHPAVSDGLGLPGASCGPQGGGGGGHKNANEVQGGP